MEIRTWHRILSDSLSDFESKYNIESLKPMFIEDIDKNDDSPLDSNARLAMTYLVEPIYDYKTEYNEVKIGYDIIDNCENSSVLDFLQTSNIDFWKKVLEFVIKFGY